MDWKLFLVGVSFLLIGFLLYRYLLKDERPSSKETNWEGMTKPNYIRLWSSVVLSFIVGIAFIFESLYEWLLLD